MALYRGKKKLTIFKGDRKPYSIYLGKKKLAGYIIKKLQGFSSIQWQAPYKARIRNILVEGVGEQEKLTGKNLLKPLNQRIKATVEGAMSPNDERFLSSDNYYVGISLNGYWSSYRKISFKYDESNDSYHVKTDSPIYGVGLTYAVKPNTTYYFHVKEKVGESDCGFGFYNEKGICTSFAYYRDNIRKIVIPNDCVWLMVVFAPYEVNKEIIYSEPMLSLTDDTTYEPYCGGIPAPNPQYPIQPKFLDGASMTARGKNLIPFPYAEIKDKYGITVFIDSKNRIHFTGKSQQDYRCDLFNDLKLKKGTYTISGSKIEKRISVWFWNDTTGNYTRNGSIEVGEGDSTEAYITIPSGIELNDEIISPQLEIGDTPTVYEPYKQPQTVAIPTLRKIPDTDICDSYNAETGEIVRRVGEVILTGNEKMFQYNYENNQGMAILNVLEQDLVRPTGLCTHEIKVGNYGQVSDHYMWVGVYDKVIYWVGILDFLKMTETEFKQFLADQYAKGTPVTVWYALAEPIIEKIEPSVMVATQGTTVLEIDKETNFSAEVCLEDNI